MKKVENVQSFLTNEKESLFETDNNFTNYNKIMLYLNNMRYRAIFV